MAADPQHRLLLAAAVHVGGVALVLAGIQTDVQVGNVQLGVVVFAADGETAAGVVDFLPREETPPVRPSLWVQGPLSAHVPGRCRCRSGASSRQGEDNPQTYSRGWPAVPRSCSRCACVL